MDTRDQTLTKLNQLHGKSHPTHHHLASLRWDYSHTSVSIMKLVMEDGVGEHSNFKKYPTHRCKRLSGMIIVRGEPSACAKKWINQNGDKERNRGPAARSWWCIAMTGGVYLHTLEDCSAEAFINAVDVVVRLRDPTDQVPNAQHLRVLRTFISMTSSPSRSNKTGEVVDEFR